MAIAFELYFKVRHYDVSGKPELIETKCYTSPCFTDNFHTLGGTYML